jgi:DNA-binding HxlR family transcriptional regulator
MGAFQRDFARPITEAIRALDSSERRQILIELNEAGSLSYSKLRLQTGFDKGTLNYHLKELSSAGMIRNFIVNNEVTPYTSYYEVSELGRNLIEGVLSAFRPALPKIQITASTFSFDIIPSSSSHTNLVSDSANAIKNEVPVQVTTNGKRWIK